MAKFLSDQGIKHVQQLHGLHPDDVEWPPRTAAGRKALLRAAYRKIKGLHQALKESQEGSCTW